MNKPVGDRRNHSADLRLALGAEVLKALPEPRAQTGNQEAEEEDAPDEAALQEDLEGERVRLADVTYILLPQLVVRCLVIMGPDAQKWVRGEILPGHLPHRVAPRTGGCEVVALLFPGRVVVLERLPPLLGPGHGVPRLLAHGGQAEDEDGDATGKCHSPDEARSAACKLPLPVDEPPEEAVEARPGGGQPHGREYAHEGEWRLFLVHERLVDVVEAGEGQE